MQKTGCTLCPRRCGADRTTGRGQCGMGARIQVARAALHTGEEPCLCGERGAGAVFFSGCALHCVFCQNAEISQGGFGREISTARLAEIFLRLQDEGAQTLDLVSPTHFAPQIARALERAKPRLRIPVVYNSGGYDSLEALKMMEGLVEIYLPDLKYKDAALAARYSGAADYFEVAQEAVQEMYRQTGPVQWGESGVLQRGLMVRHLLLPGCRKDSMAVLEALSHLVPPKRILLSLMSQYTPCYHAAAYKEIDRRVTDFEIDSVRDYAVQLGFEGYGQARSAASAGYTPAFDLTGV
ncbi:MAG: radical SAM protein [Clostridiales bacterium]|nr:radical SAM protein [Clostridiales bacterium]